MDSETPRKRRRLESSLDISAANWSAFEQDVDDFNVQHVQAKGKFAFGFVEGPLVKALRSGDWYVTPRLNNIWPYSRLLGSCSTRSTLRAQRHWSAFRACYTGPLHPLLLLNKVLWNLSLDIPTSDFLPA
jgi:hypothetical protein